MEIVSIGKMKTNAKGNIEMSRKEFRAYTENQTRKQMLVTLLASIAWLMEEPEFKGDIDRLTEIFTNVQRIIMTTYDPNSGFDENDLAKVVRDGTDGRVDVRFFK